jgi:hypothetical protein
MERICPIDVAYKSVENKRNINGEQPHFLGEFELIAVIDVSVEIRWFRGAKDFD